MKGILDQKGPVTATEYPEPLPSTMAGWGGYVRMTGTPHQLDAEACQTWTVFHAKLLHLVGDRKKADPYAGRMMMESRSAFGVTSEQPTVTTTEVKAETELMTDALLVIKGVKARQFGSAVGLLNKGEFKRVMSMGEACQTLGYSVTITKATSPPG